MATGQPHGRRNPEQQRRDGRREEHSSVTISTDDVQLTDIRVTLFSDVAREKAELIARAGKEARQRTNNPTQLRRFYDELVMWFGKVHFEHTREARAKRYEEVAPYIQMMAAKVAYAKGRGHVDPCFEKLFTHVIRQINGPDTLRHAKLFMEAFLGFYKALE